MIQSLFDDRNKFVAHFSEKKTKQNFQFEKIVQLSLLNIVIRFNKVTHEELGLPSRGR